MIPTHRRRAAGRQRGAALVVGLLLLLVITLLAVAGMNSSTTEFIMAGNEQFRQNAFQAAESGVEQTIDTGAMIPGAAEVDVNNVAAANSTTDTYSTATTSDLGGAPQPPIWGNSFNDFVTYDFTIKSTGVSIRNSKAEHDQGVAVLAPASTDTGPTNPGNDTFQ